MSSHPKPVSIVLVICFVSAPYGWSQVADQQVEPNRLEKLEANIPAAVLADKIASWERSKRKDTQTEKTSGNLQLTARIRSLYSRSLETLNTEKRITQFSKVFRNKEKEIREIYKNRILVRGSDALLIRTVDTNSTSECDDLISFLEMEEEKRTSVFNKKLCAVLDKSERQTATRILVGELKFSAFEFKVVRDEFEVDENQATRILQAVRKNQARFLALRRSPQPDKADVYEALNFARMIGLLRPEQSRRFLRYAFSLEKTEPLSKISEKLNEPKDLPVRHAIEDLTAHK